MVDKGISKGHPLKFENTFLNGPRFYLKRSGDPRKPRNLDQGLPHRKEAGNPMSRSEVRGILVWVGVSD